MRKTILILLTLTMIILCAFSSCSHIDNASQKENKNMIGEANEMFELTIEENSGTISIGSTVTYFAVLTNKTNETYDLEHGIPLITLYVAPKGEYVNVGVGSTLVKTQITGNEKISKQINVDFEEAGIYVVKAFASFSINGTDYKIEADSVEIQVL